jgi:ABC-type Na+ efflux pump permease subunit
MTRTIAPEPGIGTLEALDAETAGDRLRWFAVDSWVLAKRGMQHSLAQPSMVAANLAFPVMFILLFGYVFGSGIEVPGGGSYRAFLMPGLFVMTMAFGIGETMMGVTTDVDKGITDRFRSLPLSPPAPVVGRSISDMVTSVVGLVVMVVCGLFVGWGWEDGLGNAVLAFGLLLLLRFSFLWIGIFLGLMVPNPETAGAVYGLLFPITMLTNAFVDTSLMPGWLATICNWNPLSSSVLAVRELFGNPGGGGDGSWITEHALLMAVVWPVLILVVFVPLAVRRYQRLSR